MASPDRILIALLAVAPCACFACGGDSGPPPSSTDAGGPDAAGPADAFVADAADAGGQPDATLPPDPATVAPPVAASVPTALGDAVRFLYEGASPIQVDVTPGAIEPARVAVLRGAVEDPAGAPLPGVLVRVVGHGELGHTLSRADGRFDLAVNGGGKIAIALSRAGLLPAERQVDVPWRDYVELPVVVLRAEDPASTLVELGPASAAQLAESSVTSDADGERRAAILFPAATTAELVLPGGERQVVGALTVRATEYTAGEAGPASMPALLPPSSAYTYAVELSADEAIAAGATALEFSRPLSFYVDDFLGMPPGTAVPAAWYDRERAAWVPSEDGRVVRVLSVEGGVAAIDGDGDGAPDDASQLEALGIDGAERSTLGRYPAGHTLWRVPIRHFTSYDLNYGVVPPTRATPPSSPPPFSDPQLDDPNTQGDLGTLELETRTFREALPIVGTPFRLSYASDRVPGRSAGRTLVVPLTTADPPPDLQAIDLEVQVAGRTFREHFAPASALSHTIVWDGRDAYGRAVQGPQPVTARIDYVYEGYYALPPYVARSFGLPSRSPGPVRARRPVVLSRTTRTELAGGLGVFDARGLGLGGWSLDALHVYDANARALLLGDGRRRTAASHDTRAVVTVAGRCGDETDELGATAEAPIGWPNGLAVGPDGSVFVSSVGRVREVARDGRVTLIAGTGEKGSGGDGGAATDASLDVAAGIAIGPDGAVYVAEHDGHRVRRVAGGLIETVAGTGEAGLDGDGGPAVLAKLDGPTSLAIAGDGTLFITDSNNHRVRRVGPDGAIHTLVRCPTCPGEGLPLDLDHPLGLALAPDGSLYVGAGRLGCVHRVSPDGAAAVAVGACGAPGSGGEGVPAVEANVGPVTDLAVARDGTLYVAEACFHRIRAVDPAGIIRTLTGCRPGGGPCQATCDAPEGTMASATAAISVRALAAGPGGTLYFAGADHRVRAVSPVMPGVGEGLVVPSAEGDTAFVFDRAGRHVETRHALTGATLLAFGYGGDGRLDTLTDGAGNVTRIERDTTSRAPVAIVAPGGQRTTLELDLAGFLTRVVNPAGEAFQLASTADGLLTSVTGPAGDAYAIEYDALGRVTLARTPSGGETVLTARPGREVIERRDPLGRVTVVGVDRQPAGDHERSIERPDGTRVATVDGADGTRASTGPDGSRAEGTRAPDDRFGMLAPSLVSGTFEAPSGLALTMAFSRRVTLDPTAPLVPRAMIESSTVGASARSTRYDGAARTFTTRSAAGRVVTWTIDALGRVTEHRVGTLAPVHMTYDARGHLESISQGSGAAARTTRFGYDAAGDLTTVTDALGRVQALEYDVAGRVVARSAAGSTGRFTYDAAGRLHTVVPPGQASHTLEHAPDGELRSYAPPGSAPVVYAYDLAGALTGVTGPVTALTVEHDSAGRPALETAGATSIGRTYGADGRVASIVRDGEALLFERDGPLETAFEWQGRVAGRVSTTYDQSLRRTSLRVGALTPVALAYDADGRPTALGALEVRYDTGTGLRAGASIGVLEDTLERDELGEVVALETRAAGRTLLRLELTRDALGRVTHVEETSPDGSTARDYAYDPAGRLQAVTEGSATLEAYGYDENGNRTSASAGGASFTARFDDQDRILEAGTTRYVHDDEGRRAAERTATGTTSYTFDGFGRLTGATLSTGTRIDYVLDGLHRRVGRLVDGQLRRGFLYLDGRVVAELDGDLAVVSRFVYGNRPGAPELMLRAGRTYRIVTDALGSPRLVVDAADGTIAQRMRFDGYGRVLEDTSPGLQPFGFAGGLLDPDTGLVHLGAREYDPATGRWLSRDPARFAGGDFNLFAYAHGDPVNGRDPSGLGPDTPSIESLAWKWNELYPGQDTRWKDPADVAEILGVPSLTRDQMAQIDHINTSMQTMQFMVPIEADDYLITSYGKRGLRLVLAIPAANIPIAYELGKAFDQATGWDVAGRFAADTGSFNTPDTSRASLTGLWRGVEGLFLSVGSQQ